MTAISLFASWFVRLIPVTMIDLTRDKGLNSISNMTAPTLRLPNQFDVSVT